MQRRTVGGGGWLMNQQQEKISSFTNDKCGGDQAPTGWRTAGHASRMATFLDAKNDFSNTISVDPADRA